MHVHVCAARTHTRCCFTSSPSLLFHTQPSLTLLPQQQTWAKEAARTETGCLVELKQKRHVAEMSLAIVLGKPSCLQVLARLRNQRKFLRRSNLGGSGLGPQSAPVVLSLSAQLTKAGSLLWGSWADTKYHKTSAYQKRDFSERYCHPVSMHKVPSCYISYNYVRLGNRRSSHQLPYPEEAGEDGGARWRESVDRHILRKQRWERRQTPGSSQRGMG